MPGRDGSGPSGMGSRTGRGMGMCQGTDAPANAAGYGAGRGGFGRGFGGRGFGGRGFGGRCWGGAPVAPSAAMTKQGLEAQASLLEAELEAVRQRIADQED